jgi:hypothetical protein
MSHVVHVAHNDKKIIVPLHFKFSREVQSLHEDLHNQEPGGPTHTMHTIIGEFVAFKGGMGLRLKKKNSKWFGPVETKTVRNTHGFVNFKKTIDLFLHTEFGFSKRSSRNPLDFAGFACETLNTDVKRCLPKRAYT